MKNRALTRTAVGVLACALVVAVLVPGCGQDEGAKKSGQPAPEQPQKSEHPEHPK